MNYDCSITWLLYVLVNTQLRVLYMVYGHEQLTMVEPLSALLMTVSVYLARFDIANLSFLVRLSRLVWVSLRLVNSVFSFSMVYSF